jgi:hypothetical protein
MKTRKSILRYLAILGLAAATPVYSTTLEYSTRASWQAAVSAITTTTFDTAVVGYYTPPAPDAAPLVYALGGITLDGVKFQVFNNATEGAFRILNGGPAQTYYNWGSGAILQGEQYVGALVHLHITLPVAVLGWGVDLMTNQPYGASLTAQVNNTGCPLTLNCVAPTFTNPTRAFYGMTSDTPFTFVDLFYPSNVFGEIDNFSTATALIGGGGGDPPPTSETPEIGTIMLCATGLISLAKAKKLRALISA